MIVEFIVKNNEDIVYDAGLQNTAKAVFKTIDCQIREAIKVLEDHEIEYNDILKLIAEKYKMKDLNSFINLIHKYNP